MTTQRREASPTSWSSAAASAARSPPTTWRPAAPRWSCWSAGRGWRPTSSTTTSSSARPPPGSSTSSSGDGMSVLGGNCVGGGSVVYFATMPRAPQLRLRAAGQHRPADVAGGDQPRHPGPLVRPGRARRCRSAEQRWEHGPLRRAACGRPPATTPGAPPTRCRSRSTPTLCTNCNWMMAGCRFDAKRSLLLNYLPARGRARRADPAAARGAADLQDRRRRLPGALQRHRRRGLPGADRQRHDRRQDRHRGGRRRRPRR